MSNNATHLKQDWHPADIKAAIEKKGTTLAELARQHGYNRPTSFYNALKIRYPKVERIIAAFLEVEPEEIWPSRYEKKQIDFKTNLTHPHSRRVA
ncbi:helix-turn-helix transcriptional regulator [Amphritea sp. 2_MG-2023]|uniref:helix-turn-helix domain-containing protein n=1 Tax=Amphritea TaxID=515417 RepID=UPI001C065AF3|nr:MULTISPECIES: helix-turn-helix transcriptional regulator [Amphritea]MBU2967090.1 helix-turn-helix domain-containing protein [Amphritea atlantica]MDO6419357.1 helix-turn-helix transcriptional regulator [Amphritea sp. 2_MG-2023]